MSDHEFQIDEQNIGFDDIMHIAAGRITSKRLYKILNHHDYLELTEESDEEENPVLEDNFQAFTNPRPVLFCPSLLVNSAA